MRRSLLLFLLLSALVPALAFAESDAEKKKKAEESLRQEAKELAEKGVQDGPGFVSVQGRFALAKDLVGDDKPFPKVIGYLSGSSGAYPVMVKEASVASTLQGFDGRDVTASGRILDKGDAGRLFIVTSIVIPSGAPEVKRKRGGLP